MPKIKRDDAKRILKGVADHTSFWIHKGPVVGNIKGLLKVFEHMEQHTFIHHVNKDKNDFSFWIKEVFGDRVLARQLKRSKTLETSIEKLKERIHILHGISRRKD